MSNTADFKLSKYIIPSVISMMVVGTNANIDGLFIGRILGDDGLAAINIAWPIVAFVASVGTGIGVGGAVILNRIRGKGDIQEAEEIKNTALALLFGIGVIIGLIISLGCMPILKFMGAEGRVLKYAYDYSIVISIGAILQIVAAGLLVLLRNDYKTYQSMIFSLVGLFVHIALDFILADSLQMIGVALATVISQALIVILGIFTLDINKNYRSKFKYIKDILKDSGAPFGINFVPSLVLLFTNFFALKFGGVAAVSAYAAMSYAVYTFDYIFQGICDGIQPIISYCEGANDKKQKLKAVKNAGITLFVFSLLCIAITPLLIKFMPSILKVSDEAARMMNGGFWIYAVCYPFKAFVKFVCSYYSAAGKRSLSNIIVYLDPVLMTPGFLLILTKLFDVNGVWLSMTASQVLLSLISVIVLYKCRAN